MRISLLFIIPVAAVAFGSGGAYETVYKWRDANGHIRYSNVSPPASSKFEVTISPRPSEKPDAPETVAFTKEPADDSERRILHENILKRVEERKASIAEIEKLLRRRPGDAFLTKNLMLKRKYLQNDLEALQTFDR